MYGIDRHMWLQDLTIARQVVLREDGVDHTISIAADSYLNYFGPTIDPDFPPLLNALIAAINGVTTATYEWVAYTPPDSTLDGCGLELRRASGSALDFGWQLGDASFTLDRRLLGYASDATGLTSYDANPIQAPLSRWGVWQTPRCASSKHSFPRAVLGRYPNAPYALRSTRLWRRERVRVYRHNWLPAGVVRQGLASDADYADAAGLVTGDVHNALEDLYEAMAGGAEVMIAHNVDGQDLSLGTEYELALLEGDDLFGSFEPWGERTQIAPEVYDLTWRLLLSPEIAEYQH